MDKRKDMGKKQSRIDDCCIIISVAFSVWLLVLFGMFFFAREYAQLISFVTYICGVCDMAALAVHYYLEKKKRFYFFAAIALFLLWLVISLPFI